uniref:ATP synthase subunit a n=1 Tax=Nautilus pompilius TaxID=34573 RepID=A0A221ZRU9_9MOLL|nr:ATP synthase F0 subunit 6 [Nautilus pompilius]ASO66655.1 ATP synthase F0 subunit 6 [Nautilus pompilius]
MLSDIFSTFDDHNSVFLSSYWVLWLTSLYVIIFYSSSLWLPPTRPNILLSLPKSIMLSQIKRTFGQNLLGMSLILPSLFLFLILLNLLGLLPYVFSPTAHLAMTASLAVPLWLSMILSSYTFNPHQTFSHLLPTGTPAPLSPFLSIIEGVSITVRPLTLSVRLAANMGAGHIILGLIGNYLSSWAFTLSTTIVLIVLMIQVGYFLFEVGVSLIQGYIFSLLLSLYSDDHAN